MPARDHDEDQPPITCTLTLKSDSQATYQDDSVYGAGDGTAVDGTLATKGLAHDIVTLLHRLVGQYPNCRRQELVVLGRALYDIAFPSTVAQTATKSIRAAFEDALEERRRQGRKLRLRIVFSEDAKVLATYPWEFLYVDGEGSFLAGENPDLTLTRYVPNRAPWERGPVEESGRIRVLVVVSTPRIPGMTDLNVPGVTDFVEELDKLNPTKFEIIRAGPTQAAVRTAISESRPHIIHFIGHGRDGQLAFTKDEAVIARQRADYERDVKDGLTPPEPDEAAWVPSSAAGMMFRAGLEKPGTPNRLIFLHACQTATSDQAPSIVAHFNDIARTIAYGDSRITAVIAMQYTIRVDDAERFARVFYTSISDNHAIDEAVRDARQDFTEGADTWDTPGFGIPVSYLRRDDARVRLAAAEPSVAASVAEFGSTIDQRAPCPNAICNGYVLRNARIAVCRVCGEPYIACPKCGSEPGMHGLVVAKRNYQCMSCDYRFDVPHAGSHADIAPVAPPSSQPADTKAHPASTRGATERRPERRQKPFDVGPTPQRAKLG